MGKIICLSDNPKEKVSITLDVPKEERIFKKGDIVLVKCFMNCDKSLIENRIFNGHAFNWCNQIGVIVEDPSPIHSDEDNDERTNTLGIPMYDVKMLNVKDCSHGGDLYVSVPEHSIEVEDDGTFGGKVTHKRELNLELIKR